MQNLSQSQVAQVINAYNNGTLNEAVLPALGVFGMNEDVHLDRSYGSVEEWTQAYINNASPTIFQKIVNAMDTGDSLTAALNAAMPIVAVRPVDGRVKVKSLEVAREPAVRTPRSVEAGEIIATATSDTVTLEHFKKAFTIEADVLRFPEGRKSAEILMRALSTSVEFAIMVRQIEALILASQLPVYSSERIRANILYDEKNLTHTLTGFTQMPDTYPKEVFDMIKHMMQQRCMGISDNGGRLADRGLIAFFSGGAIARASFGKNGAASYKDTGYPAEFIQDGGSNEYYIDGVGFVEVPQLFAKNGPASLDCEMPTAEFAVTERHHIGATDEQIANEGDIHYRSLEGTVASISTIHGESIIKDALCFRADDPAHRLKGIYTSDAVTLKRIAANQGIVIPEVNGDLHIDPAITMAQDTVDNTAKTMATPCAGGVLQGFTDTAFMQDACSVSERRLRQAMKEVDPTGKAHDAFQAMRDLCRRAASGYRVTTNIPETYRAPAFAWACKEAKVSSTNDSLDLPPTIDINGVKGFAVVIPDNANNTVTFSTTANLQGNNKMLTVEAGSPFPGTSTYPWCKYFARIHETGVRTENAEKWRALWGSAEFDAFVKIYADGVAALQRVFLQSAHSIFGDELHSVSPALLPGGAPLAVRKSGTSDSDILDNILASILAIETGNVTSTWIDGGGNIDPIVQAAAQKFMADVDAQDDAAERARLAGLLLNRLDEAVNSNRPLEHLRRIIRFPAQVAAEIVTTNPTKDVRKMWFDEFFKAGRAVTAEQANAFIELLLEAEQKGGEKQVVGDVNDRARENAVNQRNLTSVRVGTYTLVALGFFSEQYIAEGANSDAGSKGIPMRPGDPSAMLTNPFFGDPAIPDGVYANQIARYGKVALADRMPLSAARNTSNRSVLEESFNWTTMGHMMADGYNECVESVAFNRNLLSVFGRRRIGALPTVRLLASTLYLTTPFTGNAFAKLKRSNIPPPVRVMVAWPRIVLSGSTMIITKTKAGVTPVTSPQFDLSFNKKTNKVSVDISADMSAVVVATESVIAIPMASVHTISGNTDTSVKKDPYSREGTMTVALVGQTSAPLTNVNLGGPSIISGKEMMPSFDSAIMTAALTPFGESYAAKRSSAAGESTTLMWKDMQKLVQGPHAGYDCRHTIQYRRKCNGSFSLLTRGNSELRGVGPGTDIHKINRFVDPARCIAQY